MVKVSVEGYIGSLGTAYTTPPQIVPGTSAGAYAAGDAFGTLMTFPVPKRGVIYYATFVDLADQGLEIDFPLFAGLPLPLTADNAAYALTAAQAAKAGPVGQLKFATFTDYGAFRISELAPGILYYAPSGMLYTQGFSVGAPTVTAATAPIVTLGILPARGDSLAAKD